MKIHYFNALAGAGKTRALARAAHEMAIKGEKVLFVQPSKRLIDNTIQEEIEPLRDASAVGSLSRDYSLRSLHGGNQVSVIKDIMAHIGKTVDGGEILFITHQAFLRLPYFPHRHRWVLIFDEVPGVDVFEELNVPDTHAMITEGIDIVAEGAAWARLEPRTEGSNTEHRLSVIARNPRGDAVYGQFNGLARRILSPDWRVYALQSNYARLIHGEKGKGRSKARQSSSTQKLVTYSLLQPSIFQGFKKIIVAGALFKDTMLFRLWSDMGVEFREVGAEFTGGLRYQGHSNGQLITIRYLEEADWSKSRRDKAIASDAESGGPGRRPMLVKDRVSSVISEAMGDQPFAWMGNKDLPDDHFGNDGAVRLPNSPHGLNCFQHLHNVVVVSALNPPPAHFRFMRDHGVDEQQLRRAHYQSAVYQAAMRISIRDPEDMAAKTITVMDRSTATWLADLFPGAAVQALGTQMATITPGRPGRKRVHDSSLDRVRASRNRKRALKATLKGLGGNNGGGQSRSFGSVFSSIYVKQSTMQLDAVDDDAFVKLLKEMHRRVIPEKNKNFLICPATFNANATGVGTKRGLDNIEYLRGIWLDNDGGDLSHEEFAQLFPSLRMVIWNTYSSTPDRPRWRCFIPTSGTVTPEIYRGLIEQIVQVLRDEGYVNDTEITKRQAQCGRTWKRHGFDVGKFCPSSLFYAPCQAEERSGSFFKDYQGYARRPLDVGAWIDQPMPVIATRIRSATSVEADVANSSVNHDAASNDNQNQAHVSRIITAAISEWRAAKVGDGHRALFMLGLELERVGLSLNEIERRLRTELVYAHSPRDRLSDIPDILGWLARKQIDGAKQRRAAS